MYLFIRQVSQKIKKKNMCQKAAFSTHCILKRIPLTVINITIYILLLLIPKKKNCEGITGLLLSYKMISKTRHYLMKNLQNKTNENAEIKKQEKVGIFSKSRKKQEFFKKQEKSRKVGVLDSLSLCHGWLHSCLIYSKYRDR